MCNKSNFSEKEWAFKEEWLFIVHSKLPFPLSFIEIAFKIGLAYMFDFSKYEFLSFSQN